MAASTKGRPVEPVVHRRHASVGVASALAGDCHCVAACVATGEPPKRNSRSLAAKAEKMKKSRCDAVRDDLKLGLFATHATKLMKTCTSKIHTRFAQRSCSEVSRWEEGKEEGWERRRDGETDEDR
eukprot:5624587-Pleurochrysis_carterae.AAC.15